MIYDALELNCMLKTLTLVGQCPESGELDFMGTNHQWHECDMMYIEDAGLAVT